MSYARSLGGAGARDPSSGLGGSSSTCLSSTYSLKGALGATIEGICGSFGKRSKTKEVDREARK